MYFLDRFYLPIITKGWLRLGCHVLIIFVGTGENWNAHPAITFTLETLRAEGSAVRLFFLSDNVTTARMEQHSVMLSQTARLFAPLIIKKLVSSKSNPSDDEDAGNM
jgi:hypothetical protein